MMPHFIMNVGWEIARNSRSLASRQPVSGILLLLRRCGTLRRRLPGLSHRFRGRFTACRLFELLLPGLRLQFDEPSRDEQSECWNSCRVLRLRNIAYISGHSQQASVCTYKFCAPTHNTPYDQARGTSPNTSDHSVREPAPPQQRRRALRHLQVCQVLGDAVQGCWLCPSSNCMTDRAQVGAEDRRLKQHLHCLRDGGNSAKQP